MLSHRAWSLAIAASLVSSASVAQDVFPAVEKASPRSTAPSAVNANDLLKLDGKWTVTSVGVNGEKIANTNDTTYTFRTSQSVKSISDSEARHKNRVPILVPAFSSFRMGNGQLIEVELHWIVDCEKKQLMVYPSLAPEFLPNFDADDVQRGIYKFENSALLLCFSGRGVLDYPTGFEAQPATTVLRLEKTGSNSAKSATTPTAKRQK